MHMAAFNICHRSCHNTNRSFLPWSAIFLFHQDKEPLPSDWCVSIQPVVISLASCLEGCKSSLTSCCRGAFLCAPISNEICNSRGAFPFLMRQRTAIGASKTKELMYSTSFMYNGKEMKGALCVCSLVNQTPELLGRIRIERLRAAGKRWPTHTDFFVRDTIAFLLLEECC